MSFAALALVIAIGLLGPLLALPRPWRLPVVLGELLAGIAFGRTGFGALDASDQTFTFLANVGFALVMFVAGSHIPVRDPRLGTALRVGALRAVAVGAIAALLGEGIAGAFDTGHAALYSVLIASSSAAIVLPVIDSLSLGGEPIIQLLPQVAIADAACIVALPLAIDPKHAGRAALGAAVVIGCSVVVFAGLWYLERSGLRRRVHRVSEARRYAIELRVSLAILFGLAALATQTHVSIMLAGFTFGVAVAGVGEPRRLARQLFALTEGFLSPLFFVWLGASLNLRDLGTHPSYIALGVLLGLAAVLAHAAMRVTGQPLPVAALAAAQLGVPVAAATLGTQLQLLRPGEPAALLLGALVTIAATAVGGSLAARQSARADVAP